MIGDPSTPRLYFDFVDPVSFLLERELGALEKQHGIVVERVGVEINPPPHPLGDPQDPVWRPRWLEAERIVGRGESSVEGWTGAVRPSVVPWSRKAHELERHAAGRGRSTEVRAAVFRAFFEDGRDIGRVDVLVDLAREAGLDATEVKAVLDVDRFGDEIARTREEAIRSGLRVVPSLVAGPGRIEGFRNRASLSTFLRALPGPDRRP